MKQKWKSHLQFGLGLAYLQAGDSGNALEQFEPLLKQQPDTPTLIIQTAHAEAQSGKLNSALQRMEAISQLYPAHLALIITHVELLRQNQQYEMALQRLQKGISNHPSAPLLYQQLAITHTRANHPPQSHLAQAHYHYLRGETKAALHQLDYAERAARNNKSDFILFSTIDERRQRYKEKQRVEKENERS